MALTPLDEERLHEALALARGSFGLTEPNPRVGCVIGLADGTRLGAGATQRAGSAHAEVMALREVEASGASAAGATAWVTLEPCAHHGRTPPCCDALVAAGIRRVVIAIGDPYAEVAGRGIARLRAAGVEVELAGEAQARNALDVNIGFFSRVLRGRPWVRMKIAASIDGRTALADGRSQWITGEAARADGHAWRHRASAVATGIGTVLADDPRLDVRLVEALHQPLRVVLDSSLRTPADARVLAPPGAVVLVTALPESDPRVAARRAAGVEVVCLAEGTRIALAPLAGWLAGRGVNELHLEAGPTLNGAWLGAGLVDEVLLYTGAVWVGPGREIATLAPLPSLADAPRFERLESRAVGADLCTRWRTGRGRAFADAASRAGRERAAMRRNT
jgi:diaminohydroxyphosphoribosylaminopyrimidine deaminase/5-amino-6-(5-phosphoribosylamino)uracil reductase